MTVRKPNTVREFDDTQLGALDDNFNRLYSHKVESKYKFEGSSSAQASYLFQSMEHGQLQISANGSATVTRTIAFAESRDKLIYVDAHAVSTVIGAHVIDVTASSITIEARSLSGTANFSQVTTAAIQVFYQVISGET